MGSLSKFSGASGPVTSVGASPAGASWSNGIIGKIGGSSALSGAMTATVWKTALSVTGRGRLLFCLLYLNTDITRTLGMRVTVDGTVIADHSAVFSTIGSNTYQGLISVGGAASISTGNSFPILQAIDYRQSLLIEIKNSTTETDALTAAWKYEVWA